MIIVRELIYTSFRNFPILFNINSGYGQQNDSFVVDSLTYANDT